VGRRVVVLDRQGRAIMGLGLVQVAGGRRALARLKWASGSGFRVSAKALR